MSMIILPTAHAPAIDSDRLAEEGFVPRAPLCMRCGHQATFDNPVGIKFRKSWDLYSEKWNHETLDAICAKCREILAAR